MADLIGLTLLGITVVLLNIHAARGRQDGPQAWAGRLSTDLLTALLVGLGTVGTCLVFAGLAEAWRGGSAGEFALHGAAAVTGLAALTGLDRWLGRILARRAAPAVAEGQLPAV